MTDPEVKAAWRRAMERMREQVDCDVARWLGMALGAPGPEDEKERDDDETDT